ncbi:MAG: hypothetical protein ACRDBO_16890 [Lachnospiraceae bacterium]
MKKAKRDSQIALLIVFGMMVFVGSFLIGMGIQRYLSNQAILSEYKNSSLRWKSELLEGTDSEVLRDIRNQELVKNMQYISIERQIFLETSEMAGVARIANDVASSYSCKATIMRDATGEVVYESGLLDPGYYIEEIKLDSNLRKGYYPCTVVWDFYTENEEYAGETAWKIVVIIQN